MGQKVYIITDNHQLPEFATLDREKAKEELIWRIDEAIEKDVEEYEDAGLEPPTEEFERKKNNFIEDMLNGNTDGHHIGEYALWVVVLELQ